MQYWWLYQLTVTDRTNIICFTVVMILSVICIIGVIKLPPREFVKTRIAWILLMDVIGVCLLISRLSGGQ